jgi:hypothetical protein
VKQRCFVVGPTLTITRSNGETRTLSPDSERRYAGSVDDPAPVLPGEKVTIVTSGGDVPPFSTSIELQGPRRLTTSDVEVGAGEDAEITWDGARPARSFCGPSIRISDASSMSPSPRRRTSANTTSAFSGRTARLGNSAHFG